MIYIYIILLYIISFWYYYDIIMISFWYIYIILLYIILLWLYYYDMLDEPDMQDTAGEAGTNS